MSLTLYDMDGYFYDNPEKIYSVGDRDKGLVYDADGNCLAKGSVALGGPRGMPRALAIRGRLRPGSGRFVAAGWTVRRRRRGTAGRCRFAAAGAA
jgi:hypothetical protein